MYFWTCQSASRFDWQMICGLTTLFILIFEFMLENAANIPTIFNNKKLNNNVKKVHCWNDMNHSWTEETPARTI